MRCFFLSFSLFLALHAEIQQRTQIVMGTFATVSLKKSEAKHFVKVYDILHKVDNSLSSFKKDSPISKLNRYKYANLDNYAYEALSLSAQYYEHTHAYFNIAIGTITKDMFGFGMQERVPSKEELLAANTLFSTLEFTVKEAHLVDGVKIDLGGMGKGFGVDKVAQYMRKEKLKSAKIALSGDIRCMSRCKIMIQDPYKIDKILGSFFTKYEDMSISTSGNYNRYVKKRENNHLINPKTKAPQKNFISITLVSQLPNSALDAYATAASVMPRQEAYKFLETLPLAYIVLESDGSLIVSKNKETYITQLVINYTAKK